MHSLFPIQIFLEPVWRADRSWVGLRLHVDPTMLVLVTKTITEEFVLRNFPLLYPAELLSTEPELASNLIAICSVDTQPQPENSVRQLALTHISSPDGVQIFIPAVHDLADFAALPQDAWCSGAWPTVAHAHGSKLQPTQPVLLELLGLIARDADSQDLETVFAKAPQLSISMLRLVNSVAISGITKAASLRQAIAMLGRRQLQRWLQLLMYAEQFDSADTVPPLLIVAALRARRLEHWAGAGWLGQCPPDSAFFTGMLSCLDCLFGQPLTELLKPLPLPDYVVRALINHEGELGLALHRLKQLEHGIVNDSDRWPTDDQWHDRLMAEVNAVAWTRQLFSMVTA